MNALTKLVLAAVLVFATGLVITASAKEASKPAAPRFTVPPGFIVEKVAGPPLVKYPLFACFDDRGRLFVAEGTGTNLHGPELAKRKLGRILLLEDTDGDGKFDTSKVFADQLVFPQGVLWHDGALYSASHPSFWRLEDPEGKGTASRRAEMFTGFNFNGNGCDIHGPFLGPDGWLYWTDGRHGYKTKTKEGQPLEGLAARIFRCRPDGTGLERICGGGFDNPVEIAFTREGEAIGTMDQGPGDCLLHYVDGGVYPMDHPCLKEFPMTGPLLGAVRQYSVVLPAALCGLTSYRSDIFGPDFKDSLFSTHYMVHKIVRHKLIREGSTFRAEDTEFLSSPTHDLRLTDVLEDADGSLLFVDMGAWYTYGFPGNPLPRPEALGGIYRIRRTGATPIKDPRGLALGLTRRAPNELITLLDDPRPSVRDQAIHFLSKQGDAAVAHLRIVVGSQRYSAEARRNAVWALCRIRQSSAHDVLRTALTDKDRGVRMAAAHALGLERVESALSDLCKLATNAEPPMRRKAAEALGRIGKPSAIPALLDGLRQPCDRFLDHSLIYALIRINDRTATLRALTDSDPRVQKAGLIALDQMQSGNLTRADVVPLLASKDADLQQAALLAVSRRASWADLMQGSLRMLLHGRLAEAQANTVSAVLLAACAEAPVQQVVTEALADANTAAETRVLLLKVIARCGLNPLPAGWLDGLRLALTGADMPVRREALATVKLRNVAALDPQLEELSQQGKLPAELRIAALECLAGRRKTLTPQAFALLTEQLGERTEPILRLSSARTLAAGALTNEQRIRLAQALATVNTHVLRLLLPVFARTKDAIVGTALVEGLRSAPGAEALTVAELDAALKDYPAEVRQKAQELREKLATRQKGQAAYLASLTSELGKLRGNVDAGHEIFLSARAACIGCHRAVGRGGAVGPDLSKIGQFRSRAELLESIVFPSFIIAPEYRSFQVTTRSGKALTGLIVQEAADAVTLRTTELAEIRILRADIEEMIPSATSLMPDGLEKTLTRQELCDLLEFLVQQR